MKIEKEGSVLIFKNKNKEKSNHPAYVGNALINGAHVDIGLWVKKDKNGNSFFAGTIKNGDDKYKKREVPESTPLEKEIESQITLNDDLPF
jgi:hypothetical protein